VLCFALMFGVAASVVRSDGTRSFVGAVQGIYDICIKLIGWVIEVAPYAVAALLFSITAMLGIDVMIQLARFVGTVLLGLGIPFFVVVPLLLWGLAKMSPREFFRGAPPPLLPRCSCS